MLARDEIKAFLSNFLKDQNFHEEDFEIVLSNMNLRDNGSIDRYEMVVFLLRVAEHDELVVPEAIRDHLGRIRTRKERK